MNSSIIKQVADEFLNECLETFMLEESLELIWCVRTDNITLDNLYNLIPLDNLITEERTLVKPVVSSSYSTTIFCPMCNEQVAGTRFAPHLEKCMNGGKRGSRKHNDALFDDSMYRLPTKPRVAEIPDPYPSSLIVKVRLKQGVPYGNTRRIGASLEEFKNGTVGCAVATVTTTSKETIKKDSANGNKKNGSIKYRQVEGQGES